VNSRYGPASIEGEQVRLRALDGYALGAYFCPAPTGEAPVQVAVMHCGAAIPAVRYRWFARFLAVSGIPTLVYDYRGIGLSRPHTLREFRASAEDWAEYDCGGAIAWLRNHFPHAKIIGIAHSISTLLVGGAPNCAEHDRLVFVCGHTGYYGDYRWRYRVPMAAVWHVLMPAITRIVGYFPARRLGLGEDIPTTIALQWASRRSPDLRAQAMGPRAQALLDRCAALQRPALMISVSDDAFATRQGVKRLLSYYPRLSPLEYIAYTPLEAGMHRLGHFGFFGRRAGAVLWPRLLEHLKPGQYQGFP
jgi:predicted alpha/beta hydrolase